MPFKKYRMPRKQLLIITAILGLLVIIVGFFAWLHKNNNVIPAKEEVITRSTDTPDETKPNDDYRWRGAANDPRKIIIPSLGIDSYIQNVGVDQNKEIAVPNNIHFAGWFVDSVRPGDIGLSIIDGHLNGRGAKGIFDNLENITKDAAFSIEFGDGSKKTFRVLDIQIVDLNQSAAVLFSQNPKITNQVNLITCGGDFNQQARLYAKRVIISSELITL